jgi:hypothetical protein
MFPPPFYLRSSALIDAALPHIWVISRGDAGIESGVVGYWYPDSEQLVEWSYECERGGVCIELLGPAGPIRRCADGTYMRIGVVVAVMRVDVDRWQSLVGHVEGCQGVLVLALDRVVKLHHRR